MSFDKEKLLAYALGELDKAEAQRIEAFLKTNEEAARTVREYQLFAERATTELSKEKIPAGLGLEGLERVSDKKGSRKQYKIGWVEAFAGLLILLAIGIHWRRPLLGSLLNSTPHTDVSLDFYQPAYSSLSGKGENSPGKNLSVSQVKEALDEWSNRPKIEESLGECAFSLPELTRVEAGLTKVTPDQRAFFYFLNEGQTQVRLIMDSSTCTISLSIQANISPEAQAEAEAILLGIESELNSQTKDQH